jgi:hypothetical protein
MRLHRGYRAFRANCYALGTNELHHCTPGRYIVFRPLNLLTGKQEVEFDGRAGATVILPGETEAARRRRNHAEE